jgi:hypothetical protein
VNFFLDEKYTEERNAIVRLSTLTAKEARKQGVNVNAEIMGYIREAQSEHAVYCT